MTITHYRWRGSVAVRALLYPRWVTRDERLYQTTDGVGILKGHHVVRPFDSGDLGIRQELPGEGANLFCDEVLASVKRSIDVLKPERQRLVTAKAVGLTEVDNASVVRMRLPSSPTFQLLGPWRPGPRL